MSMKYCFKITMSLKEALASARIFSMFLNTCRDCASRSPLPTTLPFLSHATCPATWITSSIRTAWAYRISPSSSSAIQPPAPSGWLCPQTPTVKKNYFSAIASSGGSARMQDAGCDVQGDFLFFYVLNRESCGRYPSIMPPCIEHPPSSYRVSCILYLFMKISCDHNQPVRKDLRKFRTSRQYCWQFAHSSKCSTGAHLIIIVKFLIY